MAEMRGCDLLVDYLIREQTPYIFGYAGHGAVGLLDGVYQRQDEIKVVWPRMESAAGFMADAYYRVSGQPVATFTSCGPGSINMPIALATAYLDSVPFLAVTGNCRPRSSAAARSRSSTASIRPTSPPPYEASARRCISRPAASRSR